MPPAMPIHRMGKGTPSLSGGNPRNGRVVRPLLQRRPSLLSAVCTSGSRPITLSIVFPTTVWELVADAGARDPAALEDFARAYRGPVLALSFTDDHLVSEHGAAWLFDRIPRARAEHRRIAPRSAGLRTIDHFGFFRRTGAATLWPHASTFFDRVLAGTWVPKPDPLRISAEEVVEQLHSRAS